MESDEVRSSTGSRKCRDSSTLGQEGMWPPDSLVPLQIQKLADHLLNDHCALTPASQAGTRFTYPGAMEGWVDLGSLIAAWPGIEPLTTWSQVWRLNHYAT